MGMKLKCSDLGEPTCPFVARGENMEELMETMGKHAKKVHGYTDEQLQAPEMAAAVKAAIQKERIKWEKSRTP
jgi:predicted small metal-binding protein